MIETVDVLEVKADQKTRTKHGLSSSFITKLEKNNKKKKKFKQTDLLN